MRKISILRRKIVRAYNNPENLEYSKSKGYAGYFGYFSLEECVKDTIKEFVEYYGNGLRNWKFN